MTIAQVVAYLRAIAGRPGYNERVDPRTGRIIRRVGSLHEALNMGAKL